MTAQWPRWRSGQDRKPRIARGHAVPALTRALPWTTPNNYSLSGYSGATTCSFSCSPLRTLLICRRGRAIGDKPLGRPTFKMRNVLLSALFAAALFVPIVAPYAQTADQVTATCKDGTAFSGTTRSGACRGHGGVQSWGSAATSPAPTTPATNQATKPPTGAGRPGQVWVNTPSKVYHCPGTRWYGRTNLTPDFAVTRERCYSGLHSSGDFCTETMKVP